MMMMIIIIISSSSSSKNEKIRVTLCENAAGALFTTKYVLMVREMCKGETS